MSKFVMSKFVRSTFLLSLITIAATLGLLAQGGATGTILGTVTDNTGSVVAGASVTVINIATGAAHRTQTGAAGDYSVPDLNPGVYRVTFETSGFGKQAVDNVTLVVAQQARVSATLKPGATTETIEVNAGSVALDTDSSAVSQLVSQRQVDQLPLNGRNFLNLLFIGAGAVQTVGEQGQMRQGEGNAISINGGRPESNNYTLDGMSNTDTALNTPAVILSQDAIQEFKVQSETYSAEYGFSANQVNIVSKSGTNQLHGAIFEFNRNDAYDATTHFQPEKPVLRQNQFGFVAGGPVYIPKLYDGRNRTFWLANYEGWRIRTGSNGFYNVPTQAELNGDFSATGFPAFGSADCTTALGQGNPCVPIDPNTGLPFAGNTIPSSRFSRLATASLGANIFPAPNCFTSDCLGNYHLNVTLPNDTDQQTYRVDQNIGRFGSLFGRYTKANYSLQNVGNPSIPSGLNIFTEESTSWEESHTIALPHNIVNNFRFGRLSATAIQAANPAPTSFVSALGLTGVFTNLPSYARGYPTISFQNLSGAAGSPGNNPTTSDIPMWEYADSVTIQRGRHTIGIGFDFRNWVQKRDLSTNFLGGYGYNNNLVLQNGGGGANNCPTVTCGTGNAVADFLLGYYQNAGTFQPGPFSSATGNPGNLNQYHFKYFGPYIQDDWKTTERLTLNVGLRWDYRSVPYETNDKLFWIDTANQAGGLCYANKALLTDGVAPAGNGFYRYCGRHNPKDGSKTPFAPRLGFAYRPFGDDTVIRGGYGIYFDSSETREMDNSGDLYPYVIRASLSPAIQAVPKLTDQLFQVASALHPVSAATEGGQFVAVIISENPINPYVQQWSLSVERALARNTTLEANYVGNKGTHTLDRVNINQPVPAANPALCQADPTAGDCPVAARKPLANFSGDTTLDSRWIGYSNYNAANLKLERRTSEMALLAVYTWAKSMDDKSAAAGIGATGGGYSGHMDDRNPSLDYAPSDFDVSQRFVASYVVNLPVGRGKRYLGNLNKAANLAIGGWEVTGIATFQKGFPFSVYAPDAFSLLAANSQRANVVGNPHSGFHKSINEWFNTSAFVAPLAGEFGNSGRNIIRGPGINNWDMGIGKVFSITERVGFQFRVESFNTFNHTQWGVDPSAPGVGPGSNAVDDNISDQAPSANTNFGRITSARPGRILQLGGKITF
ncbi:MAG: hypothetical protein QOK38_1834 [Acidobacteriaceae bacterium]|nr:hypothetical protein [Acidobacteriaceae bacterium]